MLWIPSKLLPIKNLFLIQCKSLGYSTYLVFFLSFTIFRALTVDDGLIWCISGEFFFSLIFFVDGSLVPPSLVPKDA